MINKTTIRKFLVLAAIALASAQMSPLAQAQASASATASKSPMTGMAPMASGGMDMKSMMKDMNDKMASMQMTGNADIDFAMMMRIHHQGAIFMAQAELSAGKEPKMKKMAKDIISAQQKEIAQIDKFLAQHGHPMDKATK